MTSFRTLCSQTKSLLPSSMCKTTIHWEENSITYMQKIQHEGWFAAVRCCRWSFLYFIFLASLQWVPLFRSCLCLTLENRILGHLIHFIRFPSYFALGYRLTSVVRFSCFCQWYWHSKMAWLRGHLVNCTILPVCCILENENNTVIHASHIMTDKLRDYDCF